MENTPRVDDTPPPKLQTSTESDEEFMQKVLLSTLSQPLEPPSKIPPAILMRRVPYIPFLVERKPDM
jgi:hypothetical protein